MPSRRRTAAPQPWLDGHGEWSWPGRRSEAAELQPPTWVPALPPRLDPALAGAAVTLPRRAGSDRSRPLAWWLLVAFLLSALSVALTVTAVGRAQSERLIGLRGGPERVSAPVTPAALAATVAPPLPALRVVDRSRWGSVVGHATFYSPSLHATGSFYAYVPPACAAPPGRCASLYLLHGRDGHPEAFLEMGIQQTLDGLIAHGSIPPLIVIMPQDRSSLQSWKDLSFHHSATYVVEVQELVDRMLRTIPTRAARAIAGSSMGGFGAMNVALANPLRFAVVESWLGFFDNLGPALEAAQPVIERYGLHAFLYGAAEDPVAVPSEDPEFAAALRADGAQAEGVIYEGGHSLEKVHAHLITGLEFAGRSLSAAERRAAREAAPGGVARRDSGARG